MNLTLALVFFLSLMFLAMIFGDRLSLFGMVDGRWMTAPFDLVAELWDLICEATDRLWCFIFDHFWWVTATISGAVGILMVALIMVSGLSNEARAVRLDERAVMHVGSVLDDIPVLETDRVLQTKMMSGEDRISQLLYQVPSANRFWTPPPVRRPVVRDLSTEPWPPTPKVLDVPPLEVESPGIREPVYPRGRLSVSMEPFLERIGHRVRSGQMARMIQQAVLDLRSDDWRTFSNSQNLARTGPSRPLMRDDSDRALQNLYSQVRVIPGEFVSSNNLTVEKLVPPNPGSGEFEIQIRIANSGVERVSGVVVRELLPAGWTPQAMEPRGVFRDSSATWLLPSLGPREDLTLSLRIFSQEAGPFQSYTEVSAISAVATPARITRRQKSLPPVELPDVKLTFDRRPVQTSVGEWVDVFFEVSNVGKAPAVGVLLQVELPLDLDHRTLTEDDLDRRVVSTVRRLEPGEKRTMKLTVKPVFRGRHVPAAELVLQNTQLDIQSFEIVATDRQREDDPDIRPVPDFN